MNQEWRFYGRRMGRKLNKARQELLSDFFPKIQIQDNQITKKGDLCPSSLFDFKLEKIVLEIGFGNGEHLAEMMRREPETGFIGAEPFVNGMTSFLKEISTPPSSFGLTEGFQKNQRDPAIKSQDDALSAGHNVRVHMDDAIPLVKSLKPHSIDEIYVLNPDPWHKVRHHQRRIINQDNLDLFSNILKPNGRLIMSTDVRDLIEWMVTEATLHSDFQWAAESHKDWQTPPENWIPTRYETKGAKGADKMNYLFFEKTA